MTTTIETPAAPAAPLSGAPPPPQGGGQQAASKDADAAAQAAAAAAKTKADNAGAAPQGAPGVYKFEQSEDGLELGTEVQGALSEVGKELNLSNEAMQKLVNKASPALRAQTQTQIAAMVQGWIDASIAHPDIGGGDAKKAEAQIAIANKALTLGSPELQKLLGPVKDGGTGLGNHPEVIRWMLEVGKRLSPDTFVTATGGGDNAKLSLAERMYGPDAPAKA